MFAYRVGFPGWKVAAKFGIPLSVKINVLWDDEAQVFVATSDDFSPKSGLVAEAPTWNELMKEVNSQIDEAMEFIFKKSIKDSVEPFFIPAFS